MEHFPSSRSHPARKLPAGRSLGGLLFYASLIPMIIALVAAPMMSMTLAFGIGSAAGISRLCDHLPWSHDTTENEADTHNPDRELT